MPHSRTDPVFSKLLQAALGLVEVLMLTHPNDMRRTRHDVSLNAMNGTDVDDVVGFTESLACGEFKHENSG